MADESLFGAQTPAGFSFDATGVSLGLTMVFALPGVIKALKFYAHTSLSGGTYEGSVYSVDTQDGGSGSPGTGTGTQLALATYGALTAGAWNTVTLGANLAVSANTPYRIEGYSSVGRYAVTSGLFSSSLTNGNITALADNSTYSGKLIRNGTYNYATGTSYAKDFGGGGYWVDVVYEATATAAELVIPRRPARGLVMR